MSVEMIIVSWTTSAADEIMTNGRNASELCDADCGSSAEDELSLWGMEMATNYIG